MQGSARAWARRHAQLLFTGTAVVVWGTLALLATGVIELDSHDVDARHVRNSDVDDRSSKHEPLYATLAWVTEVGAHSGHGGFGVLTRRAGELIAPSRAASARTIATLADGDIRSPRVLARDGRTGLALLAVGSLAPADRPARARTGAPTRRALVPIHTSGTVLRRVRLHRRGLTGSSEFEVDAAGDLLTPGAPLFSESGRLVALITEIRARSARHRGAGSAVAATRVLERLRAIARRAGKPTP